MVTRRREVLDLLHRLKKEAPSRLLNEAVSNAKKAEANHINHAGFRKQLEFLANKSGWPATLTMVEILLDQHKKLRKLADIVKRKRKLAEIVRLLYHYKAGEADSLAMSDTTAQLKYILHHVIGGRNVLQALLGEDALTGL